MKEAPMPDPIIDTSDREARINRSMDEKLREAMATTEQRVFAESANLWAIMSLQRWPQCRRKRRPKAALRPTPSSGMLAADPT
jgi:hypothetical protein